MIEPVAISADHAGFALKEQLKTVLTKKGIPYTDLGATTLEPLDGYPEFASKLAEALTTGAFSRGITICGTGIGASIAANRHPHIRAALCTTPEMARMARLHNNANVLVLGGRTTPLDTAIAIMECWLETAYEGGRHDTRIAELDQLPAHHTDHKPPTKDL